VHCPPRHKDVLRQISQVAKIDAVSKHGHTAFMLAANWNADENLEVLIAVGAAFDIWNAAGDTALILTTKSKAYKAVKPLLQSGADGGIHTK
jgi:ankyrin repeat protein